MKLIKGNIIFTREKDAFEVFQDGYLAIEGEKIIEVGYDLEDRYPQAIVEDYHGHLILPSFTDLHSHAVQYGNLGMGFDKPLLDWLETYTFPEEERFSDPAYAYEVFKLVLKDVIDQGTTQIVFYSSIHPGAGRLLMDMCHQAGIKAYVGKVCMDRNSPDYLIESKDQAIKGTKDLLTLDYPHVKGIVTPRFVPTCSPDLQRGLGDLVKMGYGLQTHLSENLDEIDWVKELHPEARDYLSVYDQFGLLGDRTILGHCIYCSPDERQMIKDRGAFVAHCPSANFNLTSGLMPIRTYLEEGIQVGLGTDVGAGHHISIKTAIIQSIQMSKAKEMLTPDQKALSLSEAFFLATKGGGSYFGKSGSFEPGYDADYLIVKPSAMAKIKSLTPQEALEKFIYSGSRTDIIGVYALGRSIKA